MPNCRRVIGFVGPYAIYCNGPAVTMIFKDKDQKKVCEESVCKKCGHPINLDPIKIKSSQVF